MTGPARSPTADDPPASTLAVTAMSDPRRSYRERLYWRAVAAHGDLGRRGASADELDEALAEIDRRYAAFDRERRA